MIYEYPCNFFKKPKIFLAVIFLCFCLSGCDSVSYEQAIGEFKKDYPNTLIDKQFVGEGDSDHAYMHFLYTEIGSDGKKEVMWLYQRQKDNSWKVVYKSKSQSPGSSFGD